MKTIFLLIVCLISVTIVSVSGVYCLDKAMGIPGAIIGTLFGIFFAHWLGGVLNRLR